MKKSLSDTLNLIPYLFFFGFIGFVFLYPFFEVFWEMGDKTAWGMTVEIAGFLVAIPAFLAPIFIVGYLIEKIKRKSLKDRLIGGLFNVFMVLFLWFPIGIWLAAIAHGYIQDLRYTHRPFSLNNNNTVYEYMKASREDKNSWRERIYSYPDKMCVTHDMYSCGYWVTDETREEFLRCATGSIQYEKPWRKLGEICEECATLPKFRSKEAREDCKL